MEQNGNDKNEPAQTPSELITLWKADIHQFEEVILMEVT